MFLMNARFEQNTPANEKLLAFVSLSFIVRIVFFVQ